MFVLLPPVALPFPGDLCVILVVTILGTSFAVPFSEFTLETVTLTPGFVPDVSTTNALLYYFSACLFMTGTQDIVFGEVDR